VRQPNRAPSGTVRVLDQRTKPSSGAVIHLPRPEYVLGKPVRRAVYGKITLGGHRTEHRRRPPAVRISICGIARRRSSCPGSSASTTERKLQAIRPDLEEAKLTERRVGAAAVAVARGAWAILPDDPDFGVQSIVVPAECPGANQIGMEWMMSRPAIIGMAGLWRRPMIARVSLRSTSVLLHGSQRSLLGNLANCCQILYR